VNELPKHINDVIQHQLPPALLHDLRTPLGHVLGYSELLIEQMRDTGNEEFIPYVEKIRNAGRQLLVLMTENFSGDESR
jgi:signal transduction histidine kinase